MYQAVQGYYMTRAVADELSGEHQQFILMYFDVTNGSRLVRSNKC